MMSFYKNIKSYIADMRYYIGFLDKSDMILPISERFNKIKWLDERGYSAGWFADPFIYKVEDSKIQLFVEEWVNSCKKGRLCSLDIVYENNKYVLNDIHPILELESHLSFPIYILEKDKTYVYPENSQAGGLTIYEYDEVQKKLVNPCRIINEPLVDTAIIKIENRFYAFGTIRKFKSFEDTRYTYIYSSDKLLSGWTLYQIIENPRREERGAGAIFLYNNRLIRPAQNCVKRYGEDIIFYELMLEDGKFKEVFLNRFEPDHKKFRGLAMHTFNKYNDLCVVDGQEYKRYYIARFLKKII